MLGSSRRGKLGWLFKRLRAFRQARLRDNKFLLKSYESSLQILVNYCHVVACSFFIGLHRYGRAFFQLLDLAVAYRVHF